MEELGASVGQIAEDIEALSAAADTVHAAAREMAVNTGEVHQRPRNSTATVNEVSATSGRWRTPSAS